MGIARFGAHMLMPCHDASTWKYRWSQSDGHENQFSLELKEDFMRLAVFGDEGCAYSLQCDSSYNMTIFSRHAQCAVKFKAELKLKEHALQNNLSKSGSK